MQLISEWPLPITVSHEGVVSDAGQLTMWCCYNGHKKFFSFPPLPSCSTVFGIDRFCSSLETSRLWSAHVYFVAINAVLAVEPLIAVRRASHLLPKLSDRRLRISAASDLGSDLIPI